MTVLLKHNIVIGSQDSRGWTDWATIVEMVSNEIQDLKEKANDILWGQREYQKTMLQLYDILKKTI